MGFSLSQARVIGELGGGDVLTFAFHEIFHLEKGCYEQTGPAILEKVEAGLSGAEEYSWLGAEA